MAQEPIRGRLEGGIGADLVVHGRLEGKSDLRIDGVFEGAVELEGKLIVGAEGSVSAPVSAGEVEVEGELRGAVHASAVSVRAGGRLIGDVRARRVSIDDGGALQGGIEMDFDLPEAGAR